MTTDFKTIETRVTVAEKNSENEIALSTYIFVGRHSKKDLKNYFKNEKPLATIVNIEYNKIIYEFNTDTLTEFCLDHSNKIFDGNIYE